MKSVEEKRESYRIASKNYRLRNPEKIKEYSNKHNKTVKAKASQKKWRNTMKGREIILKHKLNDIATPIGRIHHNNRTFIHYCVKVGKLKIKHICIDCNKKGVTEIHHDMYHNPPQLIDIRELCLECHTKCHIKQALV